MTRREKLEKIRDLVSRFKHITGLQIPFDLWGIDIEKLNDMLNVPIDTSMSDFLLNKFGKEAHDIVSELLDMDLL